MTNTNTLAAGQYGYRDLHPGDRIVTGSMPITANLIDEFAAVSGDRFEIHMDENDAKNSGFEGRVAHGLLVLSVVDGLKNNAPARFDAIASLGWDWIFQVPVIAGDVVHAEITVLSKRRTKRSDRGIIRLEFNVFNQLSELVQLGKNTLIIRR